MTIFITLLFSFFFFFNDTATTEIYTLSLHDALPISSRLPGRSEGGRRPGRFGQGAQRARAEYPLVPRRFGGSRTVEPDHPDVRGRGRLPGREPGRKEPALRHPRARDGRDRERACAVEAPGGRRDVLH